jgi:hypothetical protein
MIMLLSGRGVIWTVASSRPFFMLALLGLIAGITGYGR